MESKKNDTNEFTYKTKIHSHIENKHVVSFPSIWYLIFINGTIKCPHIAHEMYAIVFHLEFFTDKLLFKSFQS